MCESKVVAIKNGKEKILMEDVVKIEVTGNGIRMYGMLGEVKEVKARIVLLDFIGHKVFVEEIE